MSGVGFLKCDTGGDSHNIKFIHRKLLIIHSFYLHVALYSEVNFDLFRSLLPFRSNDFKFSDCIQAKFGSQMYFLTRFSNLCVYLCGFKGTGVRLILSEELYNVLRKSVRALCQVSGSSR